MTDIEALKERVVEAARKFRNDERGPFGDRHTPAVRLLLAVGSLEDALRTAEEAARKPRLRNVDDWAAGWQREGRGGYARHYTGDTWIISTGLAVCLIEARDAEWMEAIRKLPRRAIQVSGGHPVTGEGSTIRDLICVADIEALAATAST